MNGLTTVSVHLGWVPRWIHRSSYSFKLTALTQAYQLAILLATDRLVQEASCG